jgi:hypothetical protein
MQRNCLNAWSKEKTKKKHLHCHLQRNCLSESMVEEKNKETTKQIHSQLQRAIVLARAWSKEKKQKKSS